MQICTVADNQPGSGQWNRQPVGPGRALAIASFDLALECSGMHTQPVLMGLLRQDPRPAMNGIEVRIDWQFPVNLPSRFAGLYLP